MERVLITGGAGFIGSALVNKLMKSKDNQVFDDLSTGSKENILPWYISPNFSFVCGSTLDTFALQEAVDASEIVFHLAANPTVSAGSYDTRKDFEQNIIATYNLIEEMSLGDVVLKFTDDNLEGRGWKGDVRELLLDYSRLESLGWKPKMNSREAVKRTARLYNQATSNIKF